MGAWDKIKEFMGIEDDYYEDDYDNYEDLEYVEEKENDEINENIVKSQEKIETKVSQPISQRVENKTYYRTKSGENMVVTIKQPITYEDGKQVIDDILQRKAVVLNLENLEVDKKSQIFYFVSGGVYSLKGTIQNVTKDIYVLAPEGVEIDGRETKVFAEKNLY